jgi:hypothetical protein
MKKYFFILCIAAAVGCKKESVAPSQPSQQNVSMEQQVADLIQRTDQDLFHKVYETKSGRRPIVKGIPGIFYIPGGGIDDATCWPSFNVCMVVVTESRLAQHITGPEAGFFINGDYNEYFPQDVIAKLIVNRATPEEKVITEFHATKDASEVYHIQYQ